MKNFHSITITVFAKEDDSLEEVIEGLKKLFSFDLEKEKIKIEKKKATGFDDKKIEILSIKIEKQKHIKKFAENLFKILKEGQKMQIKDELETRIDKEGFFYIRFDKKSWVNDRKLFITDEGDCYHIRFKIAAYPCNKENAIQVVKELMQKHF